MGFERNYQIKIPSKQLNIKKFSTFNYSSQFNPWFGIGLIDVEGSFNIIIDINKTRKLGWRVQSKLKWVCINGIYLYYYNNKKI